MLITFWSDLTSHTHIHFFLLSFSTLTELNERYRRNQTEKKNKQIKNKVEEKKRANDCCCIVMFQIVIAFHNTHTISARCRWYHSGDLKGFLRHMLTAVNVVQFTVAIKMLLINQYSFLYLAQVILRRWQRRLLFMLCNEQKEVTFKAFRVWFDHVNERITVAFMENNYMIFVIWNFWLNQCVTFTSKNRRIFSRKIYKFIILFHVFPAIQ